jgi:hypothetical protein
VKREPNRHSQLDKGTINLQITDWKSNFPWWVFE